jgi:pimeloyl-ACP methyl ester carboxylesterase
MPFRGHQTWYRVTGTLDPRAERAPVVVLHGGPGFAHNYVLAMTSLGHDGRAVVHYDQLGCGLSSHLPDADPSFWNVDLFVAGRSSSTSASPTASTSWGSPGAACSVPRSSCPTTPASAR